MEKKPFASITFEDGKPVIDIRYISRLQAVVLFQHAIDILKAKELEHLLETFTSTVTSEPSQITGYRARTYDDILTPEQSRKIRRLCNSAGVHPDDLCKQECDCTIDELSRQGAAMFIAFIETHT